MIKSFKINEDKVSKAKRFSGFFAIMTHGVGLDAMDAFRAYHLRDEQEKYVNIATVNKLDMIISMNFQHIVKRKTKIGTGNINALNGYRVVEICTPMEVNEHENT